MNINQDISTFTGQYNITIAEAMERIEKNGRGILFIVDKKGILLSCVTDGDIRRYLLSGGNISDLITEAANKYPKVANDVQEAKKLYHSINWVAIPIINDEGVLDDVFIGDSKAMTSYHKCINIPVVINAGGKGSRLEPYTRVLPKPLIPVGDLPIIELILREYQSYECNDFHIIVNYKKELLKAYFADENTNYYITWYDEAEPLGTGGGLTLLRGKINSTFFFSNCDVLLTADYDKILQFHKEKGNSITMICAYKTINIPYGVVEMGIDGAIKSMKEKPAMSFLTNTGIYIVEPEVINDMDDGVTIGFPDVVEMQRKKGKKVAVYPIDEGEWMDMGQIPELEKMRLKLYGE